MKRQRNGGVEGEAGREEGRRGGGWGGGGRRGKEKEEVVRILNMEKRDHFTLRHLC